MAFRFKEPNWREPPKPEPKWFEKLIDWLMLLAFVVFLLLSLSVLFVAQVGGFK